MKKGLLLFLLTAGAFAISAILIVKSSRFKDGDLFDANVEALSEDEIIVGRLCMKYKGYECISEGETYKDHYPG